MAAVVVDTDPVGALALAYDAARKALAAMLLAQGLRPTRSGGHIAVTQAITAQLDPPIRIGHRVDSVRRTRNADEYPAAGVPSASTDDAVDAIAVATDAVAAVRTVLPHLTAF